MNHYHLLVKFNVEPRIPKERHPRRVVSEKPQVGWVELNVDGSFKDNPGSYGGGGIVRDNWGMFIATFSKKLRVGTNNGAELQTLLSGVWLCKELGYCNVNIEIDSAIVVVWLERKFCFPWYLWDYWESVIVELQAINYMFKHIFREANKAIDFLARDGELAQPIGSSMVLIPLGCCMGLID